MQVIEKDIPEVKVFVPDVFGDNRGYFVETYNDIRYEEYIKDVKHFKGGKVEWVQDNESVSSRGVIRGLHWQNFPYQQAKLVRVVKGSVIDIVVDIRIGSPTYGKWVCHKLTGENKHQMYVPVGFAHGFVCLEGETVFAYKCSNFYDKECDRGLSFFDPELNILEKLKDEFPEELKDMEFIFSDKDKKHPNLKDIDKLFGEIEYGIDESVEKLERFIEHDLIETDELNEIEIEKKFIEDIQNGINSKS